MVRSSILAITTVWWVGCGPDEASVDLSGHLGCIVNTSTGDPEVIDGVLFQVETYYNSKGAKASCRVDPEGLDGRSGIAHALLFDTDEWREASDLEPNGAINIVTLDAPIHFRNTAPGRTLALGNHVLPAELPAPSPIAWRYPDDYALALDDELGQVGLDFRSLDDGQSPVTCADGANLIVLRKLTIITRGVDRAALFAEAACLRDGGGVEVCPTGLTTDADGSPIGCAP